jgi:primosomal protein N'
LPPIQHSITGFRRLAVGVGAIVRVRLARRSLVGVVVAAGDTTAVDPEKLQPIAEVVADAPALSAIASSWRFVAAYYQEPGLSLRKWCRRRHAGERRQALGLRPRQPWARNLSHWVEQLQACT